MRKTAICAACLAVTLGPAFAQAPPANGPFLTEAPNLLRLTKMKGLGVIGLDHTRVGEIEDVLMDRTGQAGAIVIGVGGFLGIGEKAVAVPFGQMLWNTGDVTRSPGPSGSTPPGMAGQQRDVPAGGAERMPGASVSNEALSSTAEQRGGAMRPESGPATGGGGSAAPATTLLVPPGGGLEHAEIHLSRSQLQAAPAFRLR